mmetsp:Transcript_2647/g.4313  ORF Transcript_2647/g.4313 Transcript_2647/m.4313 type:complete len:352 (-) Transcript_2647:59-1114(-)|eukprot:CAMPEP_0197057612 /NCGR_PEP_ID=MMETSP1384-20130603/99023_1 /TAXON_ID=29189 /ORGANISM="Ammonia sp." /LENGTH=351 /DNA_ID=CAMNT_0042492103 /DNA_START=55 /DNA_END=1110 /DNA_ORIENTATION=+
MAVPARTRMHHLTLVAIIVFLIYPSLLKCTSTSLCLSGSDADCARNEVCVDFKCEAISNVRRQTLISERDHHHDHVSASREVVVRPSYEHEDVTSKYKQHYQWHEHCARAAYINGYQRTWFPAQNELYYRAMDETNYNAALGVIPDREHCDASGEYCTPWFFSRVADKASTAMKFRRSSLQEVAQRKKGEQRQSSYQPSSNVWDASNERGARRLLADTKTVVIAINLYEYNKYAQQNGKARLAIGQAGRGYHIFPADQQLSIAYPASNWQRVTMIPFQIPNRFVESIQVDDDFLLDTRNQEIDRDFLERGRHEQKIKVVTSYSDTIGLKEDEYVVDYSNLQGIWGRWASGC